VVSCHRDRLVGMIFVLVSDRSYLPSHCHSHDHVLVRRSCCFGCCCLRGRYDADADNCVVCRILYQSIYRQFYQSLLSQVPFQPDSVRTRDSRGFVQLLNMKMRLQARKENC
jgi:hypothetical protein